MRLDRLSQVTITRIADEVRSRLNAARSSTTEPVSLKYDSNDKIAVTRLQFPFVINILATGEGCAGHSSGKSSETSESSSLLLSLSRSLSSTSESDRSLTMSSASPRTAMEKRSPMKLNK
ncbi:hypothetical protein Tcan_14086 [Toxocara canis]|uniref:Uncharacterized protein n=2 Tax=Toxocara canis TaxID=6265 RepID=A0A0B2V5L6_TOXCA|nr:hypothetical protein Tcan_14086 [Toxocara canis]VDM42472.1 unnamed protein product [Toxocara canis]